MRKKMLAIAIALMMLSGVAFAEVYSGTTATLSEISICAEADGILESVCVEAGSVIEAGELLAEYQTEKVFASQDGTVAAIHYAEGDRCAGTVLEIMPTEKYRIYCTTDSAYQSTDSTLVHSGERVYVKCTTNGTHRGIGVITSIDGSEYGVLTVGGEFHVGETVYLYRDAEFSTKERVGIGTVIENETEKYEAEGTIIRMHVREGEDVERGQLLYETLADPQTDVLAGASGIVGSLNVSSGEKVQKGQVIASIVPKENICVEISVDEIVIGNFHNGMRVEISFAADGEETPVFGTVIGIYDDDNSGSYQIVIAPDKSGELRLGMTAQVRTE